MRVYRLSKGVYSVKANGREFDVEQMCAVTDDNSDRTWALYEYVGNERQYCNHFRTKKAALEAIAAMSSTDVEVVRKRAGCYDVIVGDYKFTIYRVGKKWQIGRGMVVYLGQHATMKEALARVLASASGRVGVTCMLTDTSLIVNTGYQETFEVKFDRSRHAYVLYRHFADGQVVEDDIASFLYTILASIEARVGIRHGVLRDEDPFQF